MAVSWLQVKEQVLLLKRPTAGLLAGLWEFPTVQLPDDTSTESQRSSLMTQYLQEISDLDLEEISKRDPVGDVIHIFTHIRMTLFVEILKIEDPSKEIHLKDPIEYKWITSDDLKSFGLCSMVQKVRTLCEKKIQK